MAHLTRSLLAPLCLTLCLAACSDQAEVVDLGRVEKPQNHDTAAAAPEAAASKPRQVIVPDGVEARAVHLSLRRPGEEQALELTVPLGKQLESGDYTVAADYYLPAFMIEGNTITSDGTEENNPAVFVLWQEGERQIFAGWTFRDYPSLNPPLVEGYELKMLGVE